MVLHRLLLTLLFDALLEALDKLVNRAPHERSVLVAGQSRVASAKEAPVELNKSDDFTHMLFDFFQVRLVQGQLEGLIELWWQFQIIMLHRESDLDQVVEAILLDEILVELDTLEGLEEEYKDLGKTLRVLVRHSEVTLTLKTADVALYKEAS